MKSRHMGHVYYHGHVTETHKLHYERHTLHDSFTHSWCSAFLTSCQKDTCKRVQPKASHCATSITLLYYLSYYPEPVIWK